MCMSQQTEKEWYAWRAMCTTLKALGININEEDKLTEAIKQWGEEFVTLKLEQKAAEERPQNKQEPMAYYKAQEGNSY